MKIPNKKTGISTMGALGITIIILCATGFISYWWLIAGAFFVLAGIGQESGK